MRREDKVLVERIRLILATQCAFSEKAMFGGVCFMLNGNICVGTWKGSLLVRVGKDQYEETLKEPYIRPADMSGRIMKGWVLIEPDGFEFEEDLKAWIKRAVIFTRSLPPKKGF